MNNFLDFRKSAIRYWERRRWGYNCALVLPALFGYFAYAAVSGAVEDRRHLGTPVVALLFVVCAAAANVCYSFCYALEFLFGSDAKDSKWVRGGRTLSLVAGTLFSMLLSIVGGQNIAILEYSFR